MQANKPKQYLSLHGKTLLEHTIENLLAHPAISRVIVAIGEKDGYFNDLPLANNPNVIRVSGGKERCDSVLNALNYLQSEHYSKWVLVHDAARPNVCHRDISSLIEKGAEHSVGAILASRVRDTMKRSNLENEITITVERSQLWHAHTPQMFRCEELRLALQSALDQHQLVTDESSAMELQGLKPLLVEGRSDNIKVTQPEDLALASFYLSCKSSEAS